MWFPGTGFLLGSRSVGVSGDEMCTGELRILRLLQQWIWDLGSSGGLVHGFLRIHLSPLRWSFLLSDLESVFEEFKRLEYYLV